MHLDKYKETAIKYFVNDLAGALIPGSRLSNLLNELELTKQISDNTKDFLLKKGLLALLSYSKNDISFSAFSKAAEIEQSVRRQIAEALSLKEQAEADARLAESRRAQEHEEAKRCAFENNPRTIAKAKQFKLREKYGLSYFIERANFPKLMDILRRVENGVRLTEEEVFWLSTEKDGSDTGYFTEELKERFHENEALFYRAEFEKSKKPWFAVNASSHYRKCKQSKTAESILCKIDVPGLKDFKLKSALCTTLGGVKRDLHKSDEALNLGKQAHDFTPQDFRPCTLIGAVFIETGHYDLGQSWYKKAVDRGYSEKSVDNELRGIFMRAEKSTQEAIRAHFLSIDAKRFSWMNKKSSTD